MWDLVYGGHNIPIKFSRVPCCVTNILRRNTFLAIPVGKLWLLPDIQKSSFVAYYDIIMGVDLCKDVINF